MTGVSVTSAPAASAASPALYLNHNERLRAPAELVRALSEIPEDALSRYPSVAGLERALAERWDVSAERVLVTAGADEAIDRLCRVQLASGPELVSVSPTFEMFPICTALAGGRFTSSRTLEDPAPLETLSDLMSERTGIVVVTTPHNPTGVTTPTPRLLDLADRLPSGAVLLVDLAYVEFADSDPTPELLEDERIVVVRTLSKAWGLAGLRVGYVLGAPGLIQALRAHGPPYPLAGPSIWLAERALALGRAVTDDYVDRVRIERTQLSAWLAERGASVWPSQANFVLATVNGADEAFEALLDLGIRIRRFEDIPGALRFTLPGDAEAFQTLMRALERGPLNQVDA